MAGASLSVGARVGPRFAGAVSSQTQQLYGEDALKPGISVAATADRELLPALRNIPVGTMANAVPIAANMKCRAFGRVGPGSMGVATIANATGLVEVGGDSAANYLATATAAVEYSDSVTVSGPAGKKVELRLNAEVFFDSAVEFMGSGVGGGSVFTAIIHYSYNRGENNINFIVDTSGRYGTNTVADDGLFKFEQTISVEPGTVIEIRASMSADTSTGLYNAMNFSTTGGICDASLDAMNSLRNGITLLSEGSSLAAESGHKYVFVPHGTPPEPSPLVLTKSDGVHRLTWTSGALQSSDTLSGTYSDVAGAASPYPMVGTESQKFFRLRSN